ncbi:hypothetical protein AB4391_01945 [Vibrio lentus]|uniref:Uncharacterized protein n=1 Tax=Vibrio sp. 0908 TaxID=452802 RepID=A9M4Y7_9VIBR|nr:MULTISPECIES: hypothetical protein [Gammaproteobacteria]ABX77103.1 hypothetical protein BMSC_0056 [Vibrio sp. 0908]AFT97433.1 hypothetical protein AMBAS45_20066 [Alteromonas macleodii str. 'Balearic Sea AD45']
MATPPKRYGELATEEQVANAKQEAQTGMVSKLEFEQFKQDLMATVEAITNQNNDVANRLSGNINA